MRIRTKSRVDTLTAMEYGMKWTRRTDCSKPETLITTTHEGANFPLITSTVHSSSMTDQLSAKSRVRRIPKLSPKRIAEMQSLGLRYEPSHRSWRPVNPCSHTTTTVKLVREPIMLSGSSVAACPASPHTYTWNYPNADTLLRREYSATDPGIFVRSSYYNSAGAFVKPDWFALTSRFEEACDSLLPSSMMLGETMIENSVFVDAFKILVNPPLALKKFLLHVKDANLQRKNLGTIAKVSRESSNAFLSYNFGVKPAINDIIEALDAHRKVTMRLNYLKLHSGSYIPIRVRGVYNSSVSVPTWPQHSELTGGLRRRIIISRSNTACISSWGRVREDLNWKDTWLAYSQYFGLNKVVGLMWELIPFSFVLDWFTNAQERINHFTRLRMGGAFTEFRGLSASTCEETHSQYMAMFANMGSGRRVSNPDYPLVLADIREKKYDRYVTIPNTSGVVDFSALGLFHGLASGALLMQKML